MKKSKGVAAFIALVLILGMGTARVDAASISVSPSALDYAVDQTTTGTVTWENSPYIVLATIKSDNPWVKVTLTSSSDGHASFNVAFSTPGFATITATFKLNPAYPDTPGSEVPGECEATVKAVTVSFGFVTDKENWGECEVDGRFERLIDVGWHSLPVAGFPYFPTKVDYKLPNTPYGVLVNSTPMPENVLVKLVADEPLTYAPYGVVADFADTTVSTQGKVTATLKGAMGRYILWAFHVDTTAFAEFESKTFYNAKFLYKPNLAKVNWVFEWNKRKLQANIAYAHKWKVRWSALSIIFDLLNLDKLHDYAEAQSIAWEEVEYKLKKYGPGANDTIRDESLVAINVLPRRG